MTNSQFELFVMHSGMMQEGLKSEEALSYIIRAKLATPEDIAWLSKGQLALSAQWKSSAILEASV
jgi:hypothetical protein